MLKPIPIPIIIITIENIKKQEIKKIKTKKKTRWHQM